MVEMKSLLTMQGMMFLMMFVGVFFRKKNLLTSEGRKSLANLLINLILPCNILYAFSQADGSALRSMMTVVIMAFLIQLIWYLLSKFLWKKMPESRRGVMRYSFQFSNAGYLGNPVVEGLYGAPGLVLASVYLLPIRIFMWSIGLECFENYTGGWKQVLKKVVTHPCIAATVLGVLWMFFPVRIPDVLYDTLHGFSRCLTPVTLLMIGAILAESNIRDMFCKDVYVIAVLRLVVLPLVVLAVCRLLNLEPLVAEVVTLLVAMPVANTTAILASQHECDAGFASNVVVFTTVLSLVTIPIFSLLVGVVFG